MINVVIHLKTIERKDQKFAILLQPVNLKGENVYNASYFLRSNEELYASVKAAGSAMIVPFIGPSEMGDPVSIEAGEFCEIWEGD